MSIELKVPSAGESIKEVTIVEWLKNEGSFAKADEIVAVIETDKANVEVVAPAAGKITRILKGAGEIAEVGQTIAYMEAGEAEAKPSAKVEKVEASKAPKLDARNTEPSEAPKLSASKAPAPRLAEAPKPRDEGNGVDLRTRPPSVRRAQRQGEGERRPTVTAAPEARIAKTELDRGRSIEPAADGREEIVAMTPLRKRIAARLVEAQQGAALLTTFNEIDMSEVMALREAEQEEFTKKHGIKLGFMSFFVKATIEALKAFPAINAEIREDTIVYHHSYDVGVAVGGGRGLVVPVLRNAERMSFADVEKAIRDFAVRAKESRLKVEELQGGTFTISNGGIYGSLMSTPIVNPPQSGILGMHSIQERPVVKNGAVVVAPMMYVALTYDHRIVDGREAVGFLVHIKRLIEKPTRLLLEI